MVSEWHTCSTLCWSVPVCI